MNHKRPVNLDLGSLSYPPMAIVSILHRLSGLALFLLLPLMLYFLSLSLHSAASFEQLRMVLTQLVFKGALWLFGASFLFHVIAGLRHLCLDFGLGESLVAGRRSAYWVLGLAMGLVLLLGAWLW